MWIARLELKNFKSFQHQVFNFPKPAEGQNIVLIGGLNGCGKTTLLEALYLGLYGADAASHLARAGLKDDAYPKFLGKALYGKAIETGRSDMMVTVTIQRNAREGFEISRTWHFNNAGKFDDEEVRVYELRGSQRNLKRKDEIAEIVSTHFVPAHLAPFFFFDGEQVKKLAESSRVEQIKLGMESLLGVVLLRDLRERLNQYQNNRSVGVAAVDEGKVKALENEVKGLATQLDVAEGELTVIKESLSGLENQRDDCANRLKAIGGGGGDLASMQQVVEEIGQVGKQLDQTESELSKTLTEKLPLQFVPRSLLEDFLLQLRAEDKLIQSDFDRDRLSPRKAKFLAEFLEATTPALVPPLEAAQEFSLKQRFDKAWEGMFSPRPDGCAEFIAHSYLTDKERRAVADSLTQVRVSANEIREMISSKLELEARKGVLEKRRIRISGLHDDGLLNKLQDELASLNTLIAEKREGKGKLDRHVDFLRIETGQKRASYEKEHKKLVSANPLKSVVQKAERVNKVIDEILPALFKLKTKQLSRAVTSIFKEIAHSNQISKIEISETGEAVVTADDGTRLEFDRSAGEDQIFATSFLAGLAKTSKFRAPLIVDTPLARLDSQHRSKILDFWMSDPDRQVILLCQDEEIGKTRYSQIKDRVGKTFLLETTVVGGGVKKTIAAENKYFGK